MDFPIHYFRARQSHCLYAKDWHLYGFWKSPAGRGGLQYGFTVKHRLTHERPQKWRHVTLRLWNYRSPEGIRIAHYELVWHLSHEFKRTRVVRSKRYVRFKLCL